MNGKIKPHVVMIVDDDEAILKSLKSVLETYDYEVISLGSAREALAALKIKKPDCIVLDVRMPEVDGLAAQRLLTELGTNIPLIFVTGHGDISTAVTAMKGGAADFLEKPIDDERLAASIERAIQAHRNSQAPDTAGLAERFSTLTAREKSVAQMVVDGYSTVAIAAILEISTRTVDHHRANILAKMKATSLPQLLKFLMHVSS